MKNLIAALLVFGFALSPLAADWKNTRSYKVETPKKYDPKKKYPFILSLHGFTGNGAAQRGFFPLSDLADKHGFLYSYPSGITRSWNATNACCDFANSNDDSTYLRNFILWAAKKYSIDKKRIYVTGLSNGGFMSYRMAQDHADLIAAIAPIAGVGYKKWPRQPKQPVSVLHIHGTSDDVIKWNGGRILLRSYPSAQENFENWRKFNQCAKKVETGQIKIDLARRVRGTETTVTRFTNEKGTVLTELWRVENGGHVTPPTADARERIVKWLLARSK
ncbi:MAG: PHB depolymerase family esterase [Verrucomicrobiota bacterium]|nr:PHB depolymerase family esterase [Verrucomicrobiota bacterium]